MKTFNRILTGTIIVAGFILSGCAKESSTLEGISRSSLTGTWSVYETSRKNAYEVTIEIDTGTSTGLWIWNFAAAGPGVRAIAFLSGDKLSLATNELLSNGWIVNGTGTLSGTTKIDWPYTLHDGANLETLQATFTKK